LGEGRRLVIDQLRWLHVSDFHFVASGDEFSQQVAMRSLLQDIATRVDEQRPISFVLVTGDIAFSGREQEYERARGFLLDLASVSRVPPNCFFFVPGNHDVDRARHRLAWVGARTEVTSQPAVDRLLGNPEELSPLLGRQEMFWRFVRTFTGEQHRRHTADGLAYVVELVVGGLRLSIIGLNSPWLCGGDAEEMKLVIGERQVFNALELARASTPHLQIALAHHPVSWLQEWDQVSCNERLLAEVQFFHRGHLHMTEIVLTSSPERPCLAIAAGSSHATRFYANAYNVVDLDLGTGTCTVRPFTYDASATRYEASREVHAHIELRGSLRGTGEDLARAIASGVPTAEPYAPYLSGLLRGEKEEVPAQVGITVDFLKPSVAAAIDGIDVTPALEFLRLRNLFCLYGDEVPLAERVGHHAATINAFAAYLSQVSADDTRAAERLTGGQIADATPASGGTRLPYTMAFLEGLRLEGDWYILEIHSRRLMASPDEQLAHAAKRALTEALMHSDEGEKRQEAVQLGEELIADGQATADDYLLAAASHETARDDYSATTIMEAGLALWPTNQDLRAYARQLALRTGSVKLRGAVERAAGEEQAT
jgi:predicted MPP superfamily phosphohydrolase